jgi:predicted DCC family thiol-disulfide oxidoreductase YuxK
MQSEKGKAILAQMGYDSIQPGTVIFSDSGKTYTSYKAVARIATYLRFPFSILSFIRFVPAFIGNGVYYWIAKNRRRFFGANESCMMVVKGKEERFEVVGER